MGAFSAWVSGTFDVARVRIDPARTVLVSDFEPTAESLALHFSAPPHVFVLPADPEQPLPGVVYHRFRTNTNPILWDADVEDAFCGGADTVAFLIPPHEVRGQTLLRLRGLGVRRVLLPGRGRLRGHSPGLLALWRKMESVRAKTLCAFGSADTDAMTEAQCRAVLAQAAPPLPAPANRPPRIAHFVTSLNSGGAERQACNAAVGQHRAGLDVRVLTRHALVGDDGHYDFLLKPAGVRVRRCGARWRNEFPGAWQRRGLAPGSFRMMPPELRAVVADLVGELLTDPIDVLHCYGDDSNVPGIVAAALAGVPAVVLSFRNANPSNFPGLFRPWMLPWYRAARGRPGLVLSANSEFGARDYERWIGLPAGSVLVVRNAFEAPPVPARDEAQRWRRDLGLPAHAPVVAGIFRLQAEKRPLFFLECVARLRHRIPGLGVVLAGIGPLEPAVRTAVAEHGLDDVVRLLGLRRDVPTILAGSDVLLLTSDVEGTPNVLLEAQHCGCVPVATDAGGSREAMRPGQTGLLVGPNDIEAAVEAVAGLLADPVPRLRLAAAGPSFVAERFSPHSLLEGNRRLYRAALTVTTPGGRRRPAGPAAVTASV